MKNLPLLSLVALLSLSHPAPAVSEKLKQALRDGKAAMEVIKGLTEDDVPTEWKASVTTEEKGEIVKKTFSREGVRRLVVAWQKEEKDERKFAATIYHETAELATITRNRESVSVAKFREKLCGDPDAAG